MCVPVVYVTYTFKTLRPYICSFLLSFELYFICKILAHKKYVLHDVLIYLLFSELLKNIYIIDKVYLSNGLTLLPCV